MNVIDITPQNNEVQETVRFAAYCRVSSDKDNQLHSFASQIRYYKDYERRNPHYKLVDIYADEGITGTCLNKRDEMNRLIRDCKKGLIDRVVVKSVSRFARNTSELLTTIRLFKEIGVSVYFEEQGIDTDKLNSEMIVTFPGMAAQQESMSISGNIRWSYKKRMESGQFNCCTPAYGFDLIDGNMIVNEAEASVIRRIFSMYLQGYGKQAIANVLNDEKVPRRYGNKPWSASGISYILNNERYMGDALLQKRYTTSSLPFKKMKNHGEYPKYYVENANPSIVSREVYTAVQEFQKSRQYDVRGEKSRSPLTRVLRCPDCGRTFRRCIVRGKAYWTCSSRKSGIKECSGQRMSEASIYDAFFRLVFKLKEHHLAILNPLIRDMEIMQSKTGESHEKIAELDKEIADLAARNLVVAKLHTNGIINNSDYSAQSSEINNRISILRSERKKNLREDKDNDQLDKLKKLQEVFDEYEPSLSFDEDLFRQIIEKATVISKSEIAFTLIGGLQLIESVI